MNTKELAKLLNGRQYNSEITNNEEKLAKQNGLVVVFGASDDLTEFRGAINDEKGHYEGGNIYLTKSGKIINADDVDGDDDAIQAKCKRSKNVIEAVWCPEKSKYSELGDFRNVSWLINASFPSERFNIMEDGEIYCIGMVFSLSDLH